MCIWVRFTFVNEAAGDPPLAQDRTAMERQTMPTMMILRLMQEEFTANGDGNTEGIWNDFEQTLLAPLTDEASRGNGSLIQRRIADRKGIYCLAREE
jgi:hypothetical protein